MLEVREVTVGDADFLFRLMNIPSVMKALNEIPTQRKDWEDAISVWSTDADEEDYIIIDGGQPIGWFAVNGLKSGNGTAFLKMAVLLPEYQGKHIGRCVLEQVLDRMRAYGMISVRLFTNRDNIAAQKCYTECGFEVMEELTDEMSDGSFAARYQMERKL